VPEAFVVSHLTSETPTQFHVFMSLSYGKPIHVTTVDNKLLWVVDGGKIRISASKETDSPKATPGT